MSQIAAEQFLQDDISLSPNNKYIQPSDEPKNEWQELIQHQAKVAKWIEEKEKEARSQRSRQMGEELNKMISEKETYKRMASEERIFDAERNKIVKEQYDADVQRKKELKLRSQRHLADLYVIQTQSQTEKQLKQKEEERQIGEEMIRKSLDSLQREKFEKKKKLDEFKKSAFDLVNERDEKRRREKEQLRYQDGGVGELARAEKVVEQAKNENYKQFFGQWSDQRELLDQLHEKKVLNVKQAREQKIENFIQKGIRDQQNKWDLEQQIKAQNNYQSRNQLLSILQQQINTKEQKKQEQKMLYPHKAEQVVQESTDYQNYLNNLHSTKVEKQKFYKEVLDQQKLEFNEKKRNAERMTEKEKALNQQSLQSYKNAELRLDAMVPGFNNTSSTRLNYLVSPSNSLSNKTPYNPVTGARIEYLASPKNLGDNPFQDRVQLDNGYHYQDPLKSPSVARVSGNRSLNLKEEPAGQGKQWKMQINTSGTGNYNPITNPIPNQNQNPYFRGRENIASKKNIFAMAADNSLVN